MSRNTANNQYFAGYTTSEQKS